jgi:hypothetical protein
LNQRLLWYVRRRHLPIPANVAGTPVSADSSALRDPQRLVELVREIPSLEPPLTRLRRLESPEVNALTRRLTETRLVENPALLRSIVIRAAGSEETPPTPAEALTALAPVTDPSLGTGLALLEEESAALARTLSSERVVESGTLAEVDRLAREVPPESIPTLATELRTAVRAGENIGANLVELRRRFVPTP